MLTLALVRIDWNHGPLPFSPNPGQKEVLLNSPSAQRRSRMCFPQDPNSGTGDQLQGLMNATAQDLLLGDTSLPSYLSWQWSCPVGRQPFQMPS